MASNDEREQTINQLLTEMDGFDNATGIVVIAATNRVDILDDALLRPGRFDRKIQVNLPSVQGRKKILGVHARDKKFATNVSLEDIAKQTTGFSGADLANLLNECAIRAVKDGDGTITKDIAENVYQRIVVGAKGDVKYSMRKKELVAYQYQKSKLQLEGQLASAKRSLDQVKQDNDALLAQDGLYARYWDRQSGGFIGAQEAAE